MDDILSSYKKTLDTIHIQQGECYISDKPELATTILGSCIAVCVFDRKAKISGLCHALLPTAPINTKEPFKYVDESVSYLFDRFFRLGAVKKDLEVKVFGGGDVIGFSHKKDYLSIGYQNSTMTRSILDDLKITPQVWNVGGENGRKIIMVMHTGEIFSSNIKKRID